MAGGADPSRKLYVRVARESLPQVADRYPFVYLEHGRLEVDDSSVKWIGADGAIVPLPVATLEALLLGPGTTVTHDAVRTSAAANCSICWVGEDSLLFYAAGLSPTADTRNMLRQIELSADPGKSLEVARRMFARRFPDADLKNKTLQEMMGMEGHRVRALYEAKAVQYQAAWKGRRVTPGDFMGSDLANQILTAANASLYGVICSSLHGMGYSPHVGFIHSGSPLPFVYDMADLYKADLCIDMAFRMTRELVDGYDRDVVYSEFLRRAIGMDLLGRLGDDVDAMLGVGRARRSRQ